MIIATSITHDYFSNSLSFFDSVNKHFTGKKICFCIGFHADFEGWEMIYVPEVSLECKIPGFPGNRDNYYSLQHGEFVNHYKFEYDDQIMFIDSDMILQRDFKTDLKFPNKFLVTNSSFPPTRIKDVVNNLGCKIDLDTFLNQYGLTGDEEEFCAALLVASAREWIGLYRKIKIAYKSFLSDFTHHAAWQLFINIMIKEYCDYQVIGPVLQNAEWYSGTEAYVKDDQLMWKDEVVYFNHTKFNRNFKY